MINGIRVNLRNAEVNVEEDDVCGEVCGMLYKHHMVTGGILKFYFSTVGFIKTNVEHGWDMTVDELRIYAGLVKNADLLTPSESDAGSSAPDGNIYHERQWGDTCPRSDLVGAAETAFTSPEYICIHTSKCMHDMNQTEAEYPRQNKRSQTASLSQVGPATHSPTFLHDRDRIFIVCSTPVSRLRCSASSELVIPCMA